MRKSPKSINDIGLSGDDKMAEISADLINENFTLKKRIAELENIVSELQKPTIRHEDRWLPRLTPILTILGGIQTIFITVGALFGYIGVTSVLSARNEADKVKEIRRETEQMNIQAKTEYKTQLDSLRIAQQIGRNSVESAKQSISQVNVLRTSIESRLNATLTQTQQERDKLKLSVDRELSIFRKKISITDSHIVSLAKVFSSAAIRGQDSGFLNASQIEFLYYLSSILHETSGLSVDNDGLHYYNLAVSLMSVGKYEMAIVAFNESLRRQPKLSENKKAQIKQHIAFCQNKIEERKKLLSRETKPIIDSNKLSVSILQALKDMGILDQGQTDEILKKSAVESK